VENPNPFKLIVTEGGIQPDQFIELPQMDIIIGRLPPAELVIDDPAISRRHASVTYQDGQYFVEDLGSSNGTFLNGQPVFTRTALHPGDVIGLGQKVSIQFEAPQVSAETMFEATVVDMEVDGTVVSENLASAKPAAQPPILEVRIGTGAPTTYTLTAPVITIGRAEDNDIIIPSQVISRHHARLEQSGSGYQAILLPGVTNPFVMAGNALPDTYHLQHGDVILVGSNLAEMAVTFSYLTSSNVIETLEHAAAVPPVEPAAQPAAEPATAGKKPRHDMTLMDSDIKPIAASAAPPKLEVTVVGQETHTYTLTAERITLGRAEDNQIIIPSMIVSRHHATLERVHDGYEMVVGGDATNVITYQGRPVINRQRLQHGDILRIDSDLPGMMVSMTYQSPAQAGARMETQTINFGTKDKLTFGRDPSNDVVLDMPNVSRFHAQVERVGRRYAVTDLRSANGTFVNDERVDDKVWLKPQDTLRIGAYRLVMGEDEFVRYDDTSGLRVETVGVQKWVRKNLNILQNISLVFQPREFIVVVGQSGGGKSTLVDAIAGYRPASHGKVFVNGIDVYRNFDAIRNEIGYVPQKDIIHMELTVYQALDYAAQLRMPRDTSKKERHKRIMEVLDDLDLAHRKDNQISSLSGGQQKRVSIGVELLTRPGLFFLDEPTSGLDPGTETAFMHLCRRLADQGRTIIMVTHATKNVMLADKVVFLARGGYLAWFGPPDEALTYFDQFRSERERRSKEMEFDQIYAILDDPSKGKPEEWAKRFQAHLFYQTYITEPLKTRQASLPLAAQAKAPAKPEKKRKRKSAQVSSLRQFMILSSRNIKILIRDRSSLILMVLVAPLVGMLDLIIAPLMGRDAYDFFTGDAPNAAITLFLLTIYCLLVGGMSQMREFVKESEIYKRERLVNLRIFPYVTSKIWVALLLAFYHAIAYTIIHHVAFNMPGGMLEFWLFYGTTVLAVMAGMVGGLLASAISPAASSAPMIMILLIVPQIVLSGALAPVPTNVSQIASTRWALEGYVGITGIGSDVAADPCWKLPEELRDAMTLEMKEYFGCRCMGVAVFEEGSCSFPGAGQYYKAEIDMPEPVKPADLGEKPAEPVLPEAPEPPADKNNQVAMVQYLNALQDYQEEAERIQNDYRNQMVMYEAEAKIYEVEMAGYQEAITEYNVSREGAVKGAEGLIESASEQFGFGYVDKENPEVFWPWLMRAWRSQGVVILVYIVIILFLIKRKDII
jgi:ABC transport system ATP-binding/permease protein